MPKSTPIEKRTARKRAARRRHVFYFAQGDADGGKDDKNLLGGKGANLAEMCNLGLPVPPGFTLSTEVCGHFVAHGGAYPRGLEKAVAQAIRRLEGDMGKGFGDANSDHSTGELDK